jgi:hypothetical protein
MPHENLTDFIKLVREASDYDTRVPFKTHRLQTFLITENGHRALLPV